MNWKDLILLGFGPPGGLLLGVTVAFMFTSFVPGATFLLSVWVALQFYVGVAAVSIILFDGGALDLRPSTPDFSILLSRIRVAGAAPILLASVPLLFEAVARRSLGAFLLGLTYAVIGASLVQRRVTKYSRFVLSLVLTAESATLFLSTRKVQYAIVCSLLLIMTADFAWRIMRKREPAP